MSNWFITTAAILGTLLGSSVSQAITLGLSSPDDLIGLSPGDTVTINVELLDLSGTAQVTSLLAEILIPSDIFGAPSLPDIARGSIVRDVAGFLSSVDGPSPVVATGFYDDVFGTLLPITSTGVFYSVELQIVGTGSGLLAIDPVTAFAIADGVAMGGGFPGNLVSDVVGALEFNSSSPIPEPTTAMFGVLVLGALGLATRRCL